MISYKATLEGRDRVEKSTDVNQLAQAFDAEASLLGAPYQRIAKFAPPIPGEPRFDVIVENTLPALSFESMAKAIPGFVATLRGLLQREAPFDSADADQSWRPEQRQVMFEYLQQHSDVSGLVAVPRFGNAGLMGYAIMFTVGRVNAVNRAALCVLGWSAVKRGVDLARGRECELQTPLTPRQQEALAHCAEGKSDWDIARLMGVSQATVHGHIEEAKRRIGVRTRVQAVLSAERRGWLVAPGPQAM